MLVANSRKSQLNRAIRSSCVSTLILLGASSAAWSGNEANFVLYDHHTERAGTTSLMLMNDAARDVPGEPSYNAQMLMIERALTDRWTTELMAEGQKTAGEPWRSTGWRWENRFRLFEYGTFLNPVLYVEYENLKPTSKYLMEVSGRTDTPQPSGPPLTERVLETRLILSQDLSGKLTASFNWINETDIRNGQTEFGYALGLNYLIFDTGHDASSVPGAHDHHKQQPSRSDWSVTHVKLGAELFGGTGDSVVGPTLNPTVTQQYAGLNVMTHFQNGFHVMIGAAAGVTDVSQRGLLRLAVGYEFQ